MQAEQAPCSVLKVIDLLEKCGGQLLAPDKCLECLVHIQRRRNELSCPHGAAVGQRDAAGAAILDDDAINVGLRLEGTAGGDERLHQSPSEIERASLAELVAAFEIERADHRAHRRRFRKRIYEPRSK